MTVKRHEADDEVIRLPRRMPEEETIYPEESAEEPVPVLPETEAGERKPEPAEIETKSAGSVPVFGGGVQALEVLFRQLRGKFGREELIIILVMLLVSSEGAGIELLLLALVLIAG